MASKKAIPVGVDPGGMPAADALTGAEFIHCVQGAGHNSRVTTAQAIANLAAAGLTGEQIMDLIAGMLTAGAGITLTYNDAGDQLTIAAGGGSGLVLLEQHTAANVAALNFTTAFTATYDEYLIELVNVQPVTNNTYPRIQMSTDGGATYDGGANYTDYWHSRNRFNFQGNGSEVDTSIRMINSDHDNTHSVGICATIRLFQPLSTTLFKTVQGDLTINNGGGFIENGQFSGWYRSLTAVNAIRFFMNAGNIASGTIRVYGLAK
jgi:hypothetical protein